MSKLTIEELCQVLAAWHADRIQPCIPSEVTDLAAELGVSTADIIRAIGILLSEEYGHELFVENTGDE
jgi:hypothetical protein